MRGAYERRPWDFVFLLSLSLITITYSVLVLHPRQGKCTSNSHQLPFIASSSSIVTGSYCRYKKVNKLGSSVAEKVPDLPIEGITSQWKRYHTSGGLWMYLIDGILPDVRPLRSPSYSQQSGQYSIFLFPGIGGNKPGFCVCQRRLNNRQVIATPNIGDLITGPS